MVPFKCTVTSPSNFSAATRALQLPATPAAWCQNDQGNCTKGPKQIIIANQLERNNVNVSGVKDDDGEYASAGYNTKMGFQPGQSPPLMPFFSSGGV